MSNARARVNIFLSYLNKMKKVLRIYDRFAEWLCHFGSDKYVHLLCGLFICFFLSMLFAPIGGFSVWVAFVVTCIIGLLKEIADAARGKQPDGMDITFTAVGGIIGGLLFLL